MTGDAVAAASGIALMLTDLAEACRTRGRWEFLICISAIPLTAATASPVTPIAVF